MPAANMLRSSRRTMSSSRARGTAPLCTASANGLPKKSELGISISSPASAALATLWVASQSETTNPG